MRQGRPGAPPAGAAQRNLARVPPAPGSGESTSGGRPPGQGRPASGDGEPHAPGHRREPRAAPATASQDQPRLWHVTLSVAGAKTPLAEVRRGLEQLAHDHPFLLTSSYTGDHAEIRYWEEARDLHDAAAIALRLWGEHRESAKLPPWETVGLEVINRETYQQRLAEGRGPRPTAPAGLRPV